MTKKEGELLTQGKVLDLIDTGEVTVTTDDEYALNMGKIKGGCPSLKDFKCTIHKDPRRPKTCKDFPIFIAGEKVRFSGRCLAVQRKMLYFYETEMLKMCKGKVVK